jgi:hypothetical protein
LVCRAEAWIQTSSATVDLKAAISSAMASGGGMQYKIKDDANSRQLDLLCDQFLGFSHFAKLLEAMAVGIAEGNFNGVLDK